MRFDYMIFFPTRQMESYAKEGGSESRARRPPLHSSQRARFRKYGAYVKPGVREWKWRKWLGIGKRYMGVKI